MDMQQAAHIVSALSSLAHSMERIANALDPNVGGAAQVEVLGQWSPEQIQAIERSLNPQVRLDPAGTLPEHADVVEPISTPLGDWERLAETLRALQSAMRSRRQVWLGKWVGYVESITTEDGLPGDLPLITVELDGNRTISVDANTSIHLCVCDAPDLYCEVHE